MLTHVTLLHNNNPTHVYSYTLSYYTPAANSSLHDPTQLILVSSCDSVLGLSATLTVPYLPTLFGCTHLYSSILYFHAISPLLHLYSAISPTLTSRYLSAYLPLTLTHLSVPSPILSVPSPHSLGAISTSRHLHTLSAISTPQCHLPLLHPHTLSASPISVSSTLSVPSPHSSCTSPHSRLQSATLSVPSPHSRAISLTSPNFGASPHSRCHSHTLSVISPTLMPSPTLSASPVPSPHSHATLSAISHSQCHLHTLCSVHSPHSRCQSTLSVPSPTLSVPSPTSQCISTSRAISKLSVSSPTLSCHLPPLSAISHISVSSPTHLPHSHDISSPTLSVPSPTLSSAISTLSVAISTSRCHLPTLQMIISAHSQCLSHTPRLPISHSKVSSSHTLSAISTLLSVASSPQYSVGHLTNLSAISPKSRCHVHTLCAISPHCSAGHSQHSSGAFSNTLAIHTYATLRTSSFLVPSLPLSVPSNTLLSAISHTLGAISHTSRCISHTVAVHLPSHAILPHSQCSPQLSVPCSHTHQCHLPDPQGASIRHSSSAPPQLVSAISHALWSPSLPHTSVPSPTSSVADRPATRSKCHLPHTQWAISPTLGANLPTHCLQCHPSRISRVPSSPHSRCTSHTLSAISQGTRQCHLSAHPYDTLSAISPLLWCHSTLFRCISPLSVHLHTLSASCPNTQMPSPTLRLKDAISHTLGALSPTISECISTHSQCILNLFSVPVHPTTQCRSPSTLVHLPSLSVGHLPTLVCHAPTLSVPSPHSQCLLPHSQCHPPHELLIVPTHPQLSGAISPAALVPSLPFTSHCHSPTHLSASLPHTLGGHLTHAQCHSHTTAVGDSSALFKLHLADSLLSATCP
nr:mucin-5AC-like [Penaeus vannamei]